MFIEHLHTMYGYPRNMHCLSPKALWAQDQPHLTDEKIDIKLLAPSSTAARGLSPLARYPPGGKRAWHSAQQSLAGHRFPSRQPPWWKWRGSATTRPGGQEGTQRLFLLPPGLFCNRTFDEYACWPDGLPGSFVNVSCPWYLPWASSGESSLLPPVSRRLGVGWSWSAAAFPPRLSPPCPRRSLGLLMGVCLPVFPPEGAVGSIRYNLG